ncbi:hypothetical protein MRB53_004014 [Persea americana]|uniref:Uncharacterized protein n=1 Tax=Persea americana TaxID=3435 RepID=A0ACC2N100_PERAE|nr:hypothetical protein MRB53_004014 [Persea americana]
MAILGKVDQLLSPKGLSMTIAPLGAVSAVLFATPNAPGTRKYNMFVAQMGCAAIGVLALSAFGPGWLARSAALGASIGFMIWTRSVHPPAASLPILFIDGSKFRCLHLWYALFPGAAGCILLRLIIRIHDTAVKNEDPSFLFIWLLHSPRARSANDGIAVTNAGTAYFEEVADYAVGLLMDVLRRISASGCSVSSGLWSSIGDFPFFCFQDERLSKRYRLLRPWESPLPRDQFLAGHALSVRAILCSGLAPVNAELLESLPCLGCVVTTSAGVDHIDLPECLRRGVAVANSGAIFSEDAADYGVGLLLDVLRRISASDRNRRSKGLVLGRPCAVCEGDLVCHRSGVAVAVAVANAGIVFSEDTTDYAVGLLLDVLHRIFELDRYVQSGRWSSRGDYPLFGSKWTVIQASSCPHILSFDNDFLVTLMNEVALSFVVKKGGGILLVASLSASLHIGRLAVVM